MLAHSAICLATGGRTIVAEPPAQRNPIIIVRQQCKDRKRLLGLLTFQGFFMVKAVHGDTGLGYAVADAVAEKASGRKDENVTGRISASPDKMIDVIREPLGLFIHCMPLDYVNLAGRIVWFWSQPGIRRRRMIAANQVIRNCDYTGGAAPRSEER